MRGIEVLQAALAGKRVRRKGSSVWWHVKPHTVEMVAEGGAASGPLHMIDFADGAEWEVEEPSMTFLEAIAAMDAGQIVERDGRQYRLNPDTEYYEARSIVLKDQWRPDLVWAQEDVHAADWHIVRDIPTQEEAVLPSRSECARAVEFELYTYTPPSGALGDYVVQHLQTRWPAMFREEAHDDR